MKDILTLLILLVVLVSCQKELTEDIFNQGPGDTTIIPKTGNFTANIDSVPWIADSASALVISDSSSSTEGLLITAKTADKQIQILIEEFRLGVFRLDDSTTINAAQYIDNSGQYVTAYGDPSFFSTVSITMIDTIRKMISGSFKIKVYKDSGRLSHTITNGLFTDLPYIKNAGVIPATPTDTFRVKIGTDTNFYKPYGIITGSLNSVLAIGTTDSVGTRGFNLNFPINVAAGSYALGADSVLARFNYYYSGTDTFRIATGKPGTLEVLENNLTTGRIRANFSFTGFKNTNPADSIRFTQGFFSVEY
jgi:hypothetical protein